MANTRYRTSWTSGEVYVRRIAEGLAAPSRFTSTVSSDDLPFVAELECSVDADGSAHALSLCLHAPPGKELHPSDLRSKVALKRWVTDSLANVTWLLNPDGSMEGPPDPIPTRQVRLSQGRASRRPVDDASRLENVARVWQEAHDAGRPPVKAVRALGWSPAQAQRLVNAARAAGLIPKGGKS